METEPTRPDYIEVEYSSSLSGWIQFCPICHGSVHYTPLPDMHIYWTCKHCGSTFDGPTLVDLLGNSELNLTGR